MRMQQTLARPAVVTGIGYLTGADVRVRFLPARPDAGVSFVRTDLPEPVAIPARVEYVGPRSRRTGLELHGVTLDLVEHCLAALAGLQVDNCVVECNAPELPGLDGSAQAFTEALLDAGLVEQGIARRVLHIEHAVTVTTPDGACRITAEPHPAGRLELTYDLDYGPRSYIPAQRKTLAITPESFVKELSATRTFILESEVAAFRAQGIGSRSSARDLLVYGAAGLVDNQLRFPDECARHKILDCLGDFSLIGCDIVGRITAVRSGHQLNAELVRRLKAMHAAQFRPARAA